MSGVGGDDYYGDENGDTNQQFGSIMTNTSWLDVGMEPIIQEMGAVESNDDDQLIINGSRWR